MAPLGLFLSGREVESSWTSFSVIPPFMEESMAERAVFMKVTLDAVLEGTSAVMEDLSVVKGKSLATRDSFRAKFAAETDSGISMTVETPLFAGGEFLEAAM